MVSTRGLFPRFRTVSAFAWCHYWQSVHRTARVSSTLSYCISGLTIGASALSATSVCSISRERDHDGRSCKRCRSESSFSRTPTSAIATIPCNRTAVHVGASASRFRLLVGANATILPVAPDWGPGIVAAGAVVTDDVPPWHVVGGVPARVLKSKSDDHVRSYAAEFNNSNHRLAQN